METTYTLGNKTLEIVQDAHAESPRSWDNLGTMACFHKRYNMGDSEEKIEKLVAYDHLAVMRFANRKDVISLPIYMYDHSGQTVSTKPFSCPWDSGLLGYIFVTKKEVRENYSIKRVTKEWEEKIKSYLEGEVETYDQYLTGDTYGFVLSENGEETDSCYGFFGSDIKTNGILDHVGNEWEEVLN